MHNSCNRLFVIVSFLLIACPKEFFNVSWVGTFEGEFATQDCPRGAAGKPTEPRYGKDSIGERGLIRPEDISRLRRTRGLDFFSPLNG